jgi:hypothetical protein
MTLEAVWFKDGKEIFHVDPVWELSVEDDSDNWEDIKVHDGDSWYSALDMWICCGIMPDDFVIRIKKED